MPVSDTTNATIIQGQYGSLQIWDNGVYKYTLNQNLLTSKDIGSKEVF